MHTVTSTLFGTNQWFIYFSWLVIPPTWMIKWIRACIQSWSWQAQSTKFMKTEFDTQNRFQPTDNRSRPNWITGPGPKSEPAGKSESRGPENGVSRWRRPNLDIYSQNHHFGIVYDMIYQFLGVEAENYKFGMFCQQCYPSVASGGADIRPRNASRIHTCHLFTS